MEKRLIDADALLNHFRELGLGFESSYAGMFAIQSIKDAPTIDAVPREKYKRLECELATMKAYMRYMAKDVPNPCQYCKHDVKDGVCTQECYGKGMEHFAFEWKGLPEGVFEK